MLLLLSVLPAALLSGCGEDAKRIDSPGDLQHGRIAVYSGTVADASMQEKLPGAAPVYLNTSADMALQVKSGMIDAFCMDEPSYLALARESGGLQRLEEPLCVCRSGLCFELH